MVRCIVCDKEMEVMDKTCSPECERRYKVLSRSYEVVRKVVEGLGGEISKEAYFALKRYFGLDNDEPFINYVIAVKYMVDCGLYVDPLKLKRVTGLSNQTITRIMKRAGYNSLMFEQRFLSGLNEEERKLYEEISKYTPKPSLRMAVFEWLTGRERVKVRIARKYGVTDVGMRLVLKRRGWMHGRKSSSRDNSGKVERTECEK